MKIWRLFPGLVLSVLFSEIPPAKSRSFLSACKDGAKLPQCKCEKCDFEWFWSMRNGEVKCNRCTTSCADNGLIEVIPCKNSTDRMCHCKPGFFCPSPVRQTCRRRCEPCDPGSFTNSSNLNVSCQKHTDCTSLGKVVIKEGSATSDHVCGNPLTTLTTPAVKLETALATRTNASDTNRTIEGPVQQYDPFSKTTWILFFLLVTFLLCLVLCLFMKCKTRAIKSKLRWADLVYARHATACPVAGPNPSVETSVPVSSITDPLSKHAQGQSSFPGKNQQVTMEHVGKADGINNTVGSIFIYSPGMVILGSNSNEKKEEAETSVEDSSENARLIGVPQQESSSEEDFVRFATQEELGKELSIPIPATSK